MFTCYFLLISVLTEGHIKYFLQLQRLFRKNSISAVKERFNKVIKAKRHIKKKE